MSQIADKKMVQKLAETLAKKTHFNRHEIESLLRVYKELTETSTNGRLDRNRFKDFVKFLSITDDNIMDRVFKTFDTDKDSYISREEWVKGLSVFLRGTFEEHLKFCFEVYDMNGDANVGRDDMFLMLKNCMVRQVSDEDPEEGTRDLVELCIKMLDLNHDHRVTVDDFSKAVEKDGLLMEILGQCLPSQEKVDESMAYLCGR